MKAQEIPQSITENFEQERIKALKGRIVLVKYGGNAMLNEEIKQSVVEDVFYLQKNGALPVIVHGGGPFIQKMLDTVGVVSEFIGGHRKTTPEAMRYVEMVLKGEVNSSLVKLINQSGLKAVGLSGKDGNLVVAEKRQLEHKIDGELKKVDLGHVGNVKNIQPQLIHDLLEDGYVPVIACIAAGEDGKDYNINADMFAGHLAGALKAAAFIALTDVDGLMIDKDDPETLVNEIGLEELKGLIGKSVQGGMIPKIEACMIAVNDGVEKAIIVNGTKKHELLKALYSKNQTGTIIKS